jgi:hypothetical protein
MMGLTRATVLKRYTTENRRIQAAEHGMSVEDWVEANLAADRFLETIETMHQRGESTAAIASETGKPEADIRKIVDGIFGDGVAEQPRPPMPAGPARSLDLTAGFYNREDMEATAVEAHRTGAPLADVLRSWTLRGDIRTDPHGITVEGWEAQARAAKTVIDAQQAMVDAALNGPPYRDPTALPEPKFIIRRPEELRTPPRKERHQEAQDRALGLSMQLHVSMRTAWKYYDEANAARIEQEDDLAWTVLQLHKQGRPAQEIADMTGVRLQEVTSFIAQLPPRRD